MTDVERAYLAGIFDSRCYIGVRRRGASWQPVIEICRPRPVLQKIRQILKVGTIQPLRNGFRYRLRGAQVRRVMEQVGPMMESENRWALGFEEIEYRTV